MMKNQKTKKEQNGTGLSRDSQKLSEELQKTKEDLEDLEKYIEEFTAFLPLAVCSVNPLKYIIDVNQAFQNLTHYKSIDIVGKIFLDIFLEKKELGELLNRGRKKESFSAVREFTLISKEKEEISVDVSISIRKDTTGNFVGYFIGLNDISELKKHKEEIERKVKERTQELERSKIALTSILEDVDESRKALMNMLEDVDEERRKVKEERDKTQSIIVSLADGLLLLDSENRLSLMNPQAEVFFQIKAEETMNKSLSEMSALPSFKPLTDLLLKETKGIFRKEIQINPNLTLEVSTIPLAAENEEIGNLIILHDITREKIIERMKTEFVSLAAHQLRTPLSAIKWTLKSLLDGDLGEITQEQSDFIKKTYISNERMISLINDLLNVTRIEEGRYLYKSTLVDMGEVVQLAVKPYQDEFPRKKIEFEFQRPQERFPQVLIDVEKVTLAIQNLLDNAIRYSRPGGKVVISLSHDDKNIEFSIKDSGMGIPEDQQKRIFTKFFRAQNALKIDTQGSGLGLFIVKNVIEAHGGKIWFESKENEGTTFHFTLPIKEGPPGFTTKF